ncbi:MAG: substrate-binding domain-containing protein [Cyanobacteria bacterium P01_D01_bin.1]
MVHHRKIPVLTIAALITCAFPARVTASKLALSFGVESFGQAATGQSPNFPVPTAVPQGTQVRISSGSNNMETLSEALEQGFEGAYIGSKVGVEAKTTDQAIQDVLNDNADFAAISRPLTAAEIAQGLEAIALQRPKIAIVVDQSNPFSQSLTGSQFAQIFRGEINDWAEVGGTSRPIKLVDRSADSEVRQSLQPYPVFVSAPFEAAADATTLQPDTTEALAAALGQDGIGYVLASELTSQPSLKALQLHKTLPTDPRYPFSQPYSLVYARGAASPAVAAFLGYATGQPGQAVVADVDFSGSVLETSSPPVAASPDSISPAAGADDTADISENPPSETLNADAPLVDVEGRLINSSGFLINEEGDLVDENGSLLATGAGGVLGAGVDPDSIEGSDAESDYTEEGIGEQPGGIEDQTAERGRWWWLLLPLAGLALLIWAAGKSSREEEIGYIADANTDTGVTSDLDNRIVSAFENDTFESDSSTDISHSSVLATSVTANSVSASSVLDGGETSVSTEHTADISTADVSTADINTVDMSRIDADINNIDIDDDRDEAPPTETVIQVAGEGSNDDDWLQRAKQRINEATEQMKQTAAEIRDDATERR